MDLLFIAVMALTFVMSLGAQAWVKLSVRKWSQVGTRRGMTGYDVAHAILRQHGIRDVRVEEVGGWLSDHYDPRDKVLRLSPDNFSGRSIAAAGIAAHEVGHAVQDKDGYIFMRMRQKMVPVANLGTSLGMGLVLIGSLIGVLGLAKLGVLIFAGFVAFTVVTLPVEFDASRRAYVSLRQTGLLSQEELGGVRRVLTAAAATYVAAAAGAILQLLYYAFRLGLIGGRDD